MTSASDAVEAIKSGNEDKTRRLLETEPELAKSRDSSGISLLMLALYHRQAGIAQALREAKRELDVFEATACGDVEQLRAVCAAAPDQATAWSADGFQPIHLASFFAQLESLKHLIARGVDPNIAAKNSSAVRPMHSAAASRNAQAVELLLKAGADPNVKQHGGWTPLHSAALHNDAVMVRCLLDHGALAELASDDGKTAADMAAEKGHVEIVTMLKR